jgi:hypothetical protein
LAIPVGLSLHCFGFSRETRKDCSFVSPVRPTVPPSPRHNPLRRRNFGLAAFVGINSRSQLEFRC